MAKEKDPKLARAGVSGYNKPKRTPGGSKKFVVVAKEGDKTKTIRFGDPNMTLKRTCLQDVRASVHVISVTQALLVN